MYRISGSGKKCPQHFLLAAAAVEVAGFLAGARVPERQVAVHVHEPGTGRVEVPVVLVLRIIARVDQPPVCVGAGDGHMHAAEGIHDLAEAVEVDHRRVVDADAEVVEDRVLEQAGSAAGITDRDAVLVGGVDALVFPFRDGHPQVARIEISETCPSFGRRMAITIVSVRKDVPERTSEPINRKLTVSSPLFST